MGDTNPTGFKFEMITVSDTAKGITATSYNPTTGNVVGLQPLYALISVSADAVRCTFDGTAPVATTTGHLLASGESLFIYGKAAIMGLKMIRETGDALVAVTVFF